MSESKRLKDQKAPLVHAVLLIHLVAFAGVLIGPESLLSLFDMEWKEVLVGVGSPSAVALVYLCLTKLLLLGLLPSNLRDRLIHWRLHYPLPGARAFSVIGPRDSRVDMDSLSAQYGPLPEEKQRQDPLFYKVYQEVKDEAGVLDAHGNYLAARDIATVNAFMMLGLPLLLWWFSGDVERSLVYGGFLILMYLLSARAAQQYGARLVQNVLAVVGSRPTHKTEEKST